jgi:hypothetical protein
MKWLRWLPKRWWFWLVAVGLAAIVLAGVVAVVTVKDSTEAAFRKVKVGMATQEVDDLLRDLKKTRPSARRAATSVAVYCPREWRLLTGKQLLVSFTDDKTVLYAEVQEFGPDQRTLWDRIRHEYYYQKRRLGW